MHMLFIDTTGLISDRLSRFSESMRGFYFTVAVSLAIKLTMALFTEVINVDGALYITAAQEFDAGYFKEALALYPMPLYPLVITLFHFLLPHWVMAARFVSITASVFTLVPLYLLTRRFCDTKAAFWACAAFAVSPVPCHLAVEIIRDPLFLLSLAWVVYFASCALQSKRLIFFLATAVSWGFAVLFRAEEVVFIPFFLLFLATILVSSPGERAALFKGILVLCSFLLVVGVILVLTLGPQWRVFNRISDTIIPLLREFVGFQFTKSYQLIQEQLRAFKDLPPLPNGGFFAETSMHYLPLIYLLGLLQSFIECFFTFFIIPLVLGLRHTVNRERIFVLLLIVLHLGVGYYFVISRDYLSKRYLYAAAYLLYPWVGKGMDRIVAWLKEPSPFNFLAILFLVLFCVVPSYQCLKSLWGQDTIVKTAGEWLVSRSDLQDRRWAANDRRVPFYAGRGESFLYYPTTDYTAMERSAVADQVDLLIIRISNKKRHMLPEFHNYTRMKDFEGGKNIVVFYRFDAPAGTSNATWSEAIDLGGGWKWLSWFGYFSDAGKGWIYHNQHKWMYAYGTTTRDIWFWTADMGWLWTSATAYPYLYRYNRSTWLYYQVGSFGPRWFYNFAAGSWESH